MTTSYYFENNPFQPLMIYGYHALEKLIVAYIFLFLKILILTMINSCNKGNGNVWNVEESLN